MKFNLVLLSSLTAAVLAAANPPQQQYIQLDRSTSRSGKNILFGASIPGSSHITWVLRFLDEVTERGHNVTFATVDENVKYGNAYPHINTISSGPSGFNHSEVMTGKVSHFDPIMLMPKIFEFISAKWVSDYNLIVNEIERNNVDVLICDHFSDGCIEASHSKNVPLIITSTGGLSEDAGTAYTNNNIFTFDDFTTVHQSIFKRLKNKFYVPLLVFTSYKDKLKALAEIKRNAGVNANWSEDPNEKLKHALKIVGNFFGMEVARPLGPLVEFVGPLLSEKYPSLDDALTSYLSQRKSVVYAAFGQHVRPIISDVERVLSALIEQREKGHIDGIIWSSSSARPDEFPASIRSAYSGKTYDTSSFFTGEKVGDYTDDIYVTKWSPQMAVLLHPSVQVFVSHGGANSIYESFHAGKRLIFYPFFGDQPGTAKQLSRLGVAEYFDDYTNPSVITSRIEKVILDKDGAYQSKVLQYQALMHIKSKAAPSRAADLVEEVAYTHDGKYIPQREDVGRSISFLKRHNLDIYGIALVVVGSMIGLLSFGVLKFSRTFYKGYRVKQKSKAL